MNLNVKLSVSSAEVYCVKCKYDLYSFGEFIGNKSSMGFELAPSEFSHECPECGEDHWRYSIQINIEK